MKIIHFPELDFNDSSFCSACIEWRSNFFHYLKNDSSLSPSLKDKVLSRLKTFPDSGSGEILAWRGAVASYLLDMGDWIGPENYSIQELNILSRILTPSSLLNMPHCPYCLSRNCRDTSHYMKN